MNQRAKKIYQINVRLAEGGAAQVALALHKDLPKFGFESFFGYGYSKGAKPAVYQSDILNSESLTPRLEVLSNFLQSRVLGVSLAGFWSCAEKKLDQIIESADIVHLHVIHSYFVSSESLLKKLIRARKKIVWTLHDHWVVTGRCAFTDECDGWRNGCGTCRTGRNYPEALIDISAVVARRRRALINELGENCTFVSPSAHLGKDFSLVYPNLNLKIIPNAIGESIQGHLERLIRLGQVVPSFEADPFKKVRVLVVAHDLRYEGKTNQALIREICQIEGVELVTVGKNSPFSGPNVKNLGELHTREEMARAYLSADLLVFSSVVDNFPLTICEALCAGLPVLATPSSAAQEVLGYVDAVPLPPLALTDLIRQKQFRSQLYKGISRNELSQKSLRAFSASAMAHRYAALYSDIAV